MRSTINSVAIDFIGDIHGHADELTTLLERKLHYEKINGYYRHPERKVFFVGDLIDRGPQIREVLEIVRPMVDNGAAYAVLGNHEYNAICYWTNGNDGNPLRAHTKKNKAQHEGTIKSFDNPDLLSDYVEWFKTLPIYFEHDKFRVIHAQWNQTYINHLKTNGVSNFTDPGWLIRSGTSGTAEYDIVECLLKGEEREVPGMSFRDKDGTVRNAYRLKWWLTGDNLACEESLFEFLPATSGNITVSSAGYHQHERPVFFGHYWLKDKEPVLQQKNVCCLDFSVAKEGLLVAYSWNGESELMADNFRYVKK